MTSITDLKVYKDIKSVEKDLIQLKELEKTIKSVLNSLTKYNKYYTIKRHIGELLETYKSITDAIHIKTEMIKTLKIRKEL